MKVFHGTNGNIDEICLIRGSRYKDFGQGFYVTPDIETARRMAKKKANLFGGKPIVITYELDESALISGTLNVLAFPEKATAAWIRFIDAIVPVCQKYPYIFDLYSIKGNQRKSIFATKRIDFF